MSEQRTTNPGDGKRLYLNLECPTCGWHGWIDAEHVESMLWDARKLCQKCNSVETTPHE